MIQKEKIFEKIIKTGNCGDVSCHYECPFFKKNVCTAWDKPIVKAIKDMRKKNEQLKKDLSIMCKVFEKMKNCFNCKKMIKGTREKCKDCISSKDYRYWELAE